VVQDPTELVHLLAGSALAAFSDAAPHRRKLGHPFVPARAGDVALRAASTQLVDYTATIEVNTRPMANPVRRRRTPGTTSTDQSRNVAATNDVLAATRNEIAKLEKMIERARDTLRRIPAKLPTNQINPNAKTALHRAHRRVLHIWCCDCLPPTPENDKPIWPHCDGLIWPHPRAWWGQLLITGDDWQLGRVRWFPSRGAGGPEPVGVGAGLDDLARKVRRSTAGGEAGIGECAAPLGERGVARAGDGGLPLARGDDLGRQLGAAESRWT